MSTTFYIRVPIVKRNGVGDHKVGFTWYQKLPRYIDLISLHGAEIEDEYGTTYSAAQFAEEIIKGVQQDDRNSKLKYLSEHIAWDTTP